MITFRQHYHGETAQVSALQAGHLTEEVQAAREWVAGLLAHLQAEKPLREADALAVLNRMERLQDTMCQALGIELDSESHREERALHVAALHADIAALEAAQPPSGSPTQVASYLEALANRVYRWWLGCGFAHVSEFHLSEGGRARITFSCRLRRGGADSQTPVTDAQADADSRNALIHQGFELATAESSRTAELCDSDHNRALLTKLLKARFPSSRLVRFESRNWPNARLVSATLVVLDLAELDQLPESS